MKHITILFLVFTALLYSDSNATYTKKNRTVKNKVGNIKIDGNTYDAKGKDRRIRFVILHYTAANREKSIDILTNQEVSAHYLVTDDPSDPVYQFVRDDERAWNERDSNWGRHVNLHDNYRRIEIVNLGYSAENRNMIFYDFTPDQIQKVAVLLQDIVQKYEIEPVNILAHSDIAPQRKQDPGPMFAWRELYEKYDLGMWYDEAAKETYMNYYTPETVSIYEVQSELEKLGYKIEKNGQYDKQTQNVIKAFQYHFRPSIYDGVMDSETFAILKALNFKYRDNIKK